MTGGDNFDRRTGVASTVILVVLVLGIFLRFGVFLLSARSGTTFWSTGNDASAYILLAHNLVDHHGLSFAGTPSAYRPPLYPFLISIAMHITTDQYLVLVRLMQLAASLVTALACGLMARRWGGSLRIAIALALWMPTLVFFQPEIGTETLSAMLIALWLVCVTHTPAPWVVPTIGTIAGIATLQRFNALPLIFIGPVALLYYLRNWKRAALALSIGLLIVAPWIVRNWIVLGWPIFSTDTGYAMAMGIVAPTARSQGMDTERLRSAIGWVHQDIESNDAPPALRDEIRLNRQAMSFVLHHWSEIPRTWPTKFAAFWLSWDQWSAISGVSSRGQVARRAGVIFYWLLLTAAVVSGWQLRKRIPYVLFYAGLVTIMHLPLPMSTRLRVPLFEPVLVALAACAPRLKTAVGRLPISL